MLIPSLTTIRVEDFPTEREWIGKLLFPLNQFLLSATTAINGNISLGDNIGCQTQVIQFTYGSTLDFPKQFKYNLTQRPIELRVCSVTENAVPIAVVHEWEFNNGVCYINNIYKVTTSGVSNLVVGRNYSIILRAQP